MINSTPIIKGNLCGEPPTECCDHYDFDMGDYGVVYGGGCEKNIGDYGFDEWLEKEFGFNTLNLIMCPFVSYESYLNMINTDWDKIYREEFEKGHTNQDVSQESP